MANLNRAKIERDLEKIKKLLAADKRKWGAYDDSRGLRYLSPGLYIQIEDWAGGLKYLKWFERNFPNDTGLPEFLFEWTIILFKSNKIKEAERKAVQTFFSNTYLLDLFFGKPVEPIDKWEGSNLESMAYLQHFNYRNSDLSLPDFSEWLTSWIQTARCNETRDKYITLHLKLKQEKDQEIRGYLLAQIRQLEASLTTNTR
jgi:hypothetical protein